jgi:hypothetical protein
MTEANFSNKNLGAGGAIIISAWITHKDKGAMTSLDLANNNLGGWNGAIGPASQHDMLGIELLALARLPLTSASLLSQVLLL